MALPLLVGLLAICLSAVVGVLALKTETGPATSGMNQIETFYTANQADLPGLGVAPKPGMLVDRLRRVAVRLSPATGLAKLQRNLDRAGNPGRWNIERVLAAKTVGLVAVGAFGLVIGIGRGLSVVVFVIAGALIGFMLPNALIYNKSVKRQERIQKELPDAMDMMTVCMEAGLGFDAALANVARNTKGALASEFARVLQEMQFGMSRTEALKALSGRTTVPEMRSMVAALVQAANLGIPVASVMREQSIDMRLRRRQRAEEKAQKVTIKILFPLVFCLLPALFIVIMGPGALTIMQALSGT
jgi:tight adherence protein C